MENGSGCHLLKQRENDSLTDYLKQIYTDSVFSDLVIVCSDIHFAVHRCVLAAASSFFRDLFRDSPTSGTCVFLPDYSGEIIGKVLEFIYTGATFTSAYEEPDLIELLSLLEIGGCTEVKLCDANPPSEFSTEMLSQDEGNSTDEPISTKDKSFTCKTCGQILKTRTGLRMHLLTHEGTSGKHFTCDVCGRGFSQASHLKTHQRIHTGEKPFKCDICAKAFAHASTLAEHKNLHNKEKPNKCTICNQAFPQKRALRSHQCQGDHAASNKFPCPYCKRVFDTKRGLAIHGMHQHSQASTEPILKCDVCNITFPSEASYEIHVTTRHMET